MRLSIIIFIYGLFGSLMASAQVPPSNRDTLQNNKKIIQILEARIIHFIQQDSTHNFYTAAGNVVMKQEKTLFYADSVAINLLDNSMEAFGNIHINDADSVHTYAQYLKYIGNTKKAQLRKKVRLTDGSGTLTTEELDYEVNQKIGVYRNGGKLVNKKTTLTSEQANYYGDTRDVIFTRKVVLIDPEYTIRTDTLQYNTQTESIRISSPTRIVDSSKRIILTRNAYFDKKNKKGFLYERSQIIDTAYTFTADDMALDDSTGRGEFRGNAVYRSKDSTEGFDLIANNIKVDRKKDIMLATIQPLLLIKQKRDTTFVAADTLYVARLIDLRKTREVPVIRDQKLKDTLITKKKVAVVDSTAKYFEAYAHVKVYTDSLQGVGDSLFYASDDSAFRFFKSPVIWAKENQIVGDTIYLFLKNKKPELLSVFENALAINKIDSTPYFNQLRGTRMQALFEDGEMYFMSAKGSAENVYYFQDEQKHFISVNKSTCDVINIYLENNKPKKVSFLNKYEGTAYPMRKADHEGLKLRKFKWLDSIRPKSKADLLQYAPVAIPIAEKNISNDKPKNN